MVGKILKDRYQIEEKVGEGGMAVVYRARDALLNRPVAVKVMRRELVSDANFVERFRREAEAAAALNHPHVATVFDFGEQDGEYFLVMEYLPASNLKRLIEERGPLPPKVALEIAIQVCDALKYAHSNGIIHRDVKPQNVLFTDDGKAKLTDFGIARAITAQTPLTGTGQLVGSVHYMSPEQARGLGASERSDVYALGIMLFEMLSGKVPFDADTPVAVALKHIQEQPPAIREIDPSLSSSIEYVISKALRKETTARYQNAHELMQDLVKVKEGHQVVPGIPPAVEKTATAVLERRRIQEETAVGRTIVAPPPSPPAARPEALVSPMTWVILVLTVLIVAGAATYIFLSGPRKTPATAQLISVPNLLGLDRQSAVDKLSLQGLFARVVQKENPKETPDTVIDQSPEPGKQLPEGSTVEIWVATRPGAVEVPNLVGIPLDKAQEILNTVGLRVGTLVNRPSQEMEQGYVLKQEPPPGASALPGDAVNLILAEKEGVLPPTPPPTRPDGEEQPTPPSSDTLTVKITPIVTSDETKEVDVQIEVAANAAKSHAIRIVLKDDEGERTVEQRTLEPGERAFHERYDAQGKASIKIIDNGSEVKSVNF